jgi:hypothetical protein
MKTKLALFICVLGLLTACNLGIPKPINDFTSIPPTSLPFPTDLPPTSDPIDSEIIPSSEPVSLNQSILDLSSQVVQALKSQDFISLSSYVHPGEGVRFSPYAYVHESNQVFTSDLIANILADSKVYTWGAYAGTGEPINLSFPDYYSKFIYDEDFINATQVALNYPLSTGNSIDNSAEFYNGSMFVEY